MIVRSIIQQVLADLAYFPVVGIIGPRQVGKTTLAKMLQPEVNKEVLYLDLELPSDLQKLQDAESYLSQHLDKCVMIDEIQRLPQLFSLLRALVDIKKEPARFVLLGSASPRLIREASETLAGRIAYSELPPFSYSEIAHLYAMPVHWLKGGFPDALLAPSDDLSWRWLENFAQTFIERDLRELGQEITPHLLRRMLSMLSHLHGQLLNITDLSRSLGISQPTVRRYLDLLEGGFIIHRLLPYFKNVGKRLVKSPRIYIRDSGLMHYLAGIRDQEQLYGHVQVGASWEGYVIEQIKRQLNPGWSLFFYRSHTGAEIDLLLQSPKGKLTAIEIKHSNAPVVSKGFHIALEDIQPDHRYIITPSSEAYPKSSDLWVYGFAQFLEEVLPGLD
ncbi:MAG TPA: ATP-binding protein [Saprospiraceae bacterium]|nr:ATP-binding protein [Saprospiraceae bacterium]HMQ82434.1 ATP-binding protein [Saprospiraceae bacterium]